MDANQVAPVQGLTHLKFGGGASETVVHPAVLVLILIAGVLICVWPRNRALVVFLAASLLIPVDQVLLIGAAHFSMLRILVLFGIFRMLRERSASRLRVFSGGVNRLDVAVILLTVFVTLNGILLFQVSGAVINQLGQLYTVFGVYFLLRFMIRSEEDVVGAIRAFAWIAAAVAFVMAYEVTTGHNPYALLGGAEAAKYASLVARDDRFRAQGPFAHSITAGTFGAVLVPLFVALWWKGKRYHRVVMVGMVSATVITLACNSSTPVLAYAAGILALCFWPLRRQMRMIRWGILITLVVLQLVLKNPVWHLITRIDISGGSSSWHRFMLIDQCIRHFGDWWLMGVKDTSAWGWDMWDTANQYVGICDSSGLLPFLLFLTIIVYGFKFVGNARRAASKVKDKQKALFFWAIGSALFANVVAFFGISYFDQTLVAWYALLAMLPALIAMPRKEINQAQESFVDEGVTEVRESVSPALV
jgi:hypothetical protein